MSKFTFVELFAGIGGVSFGFERLGGECVLAAEFDPARKGLRQFAQEAYKILHPGVPMFDDVCDLHADDVPEHDVLSFTFPCQAFSVAGKRGGFEDARGSLIFEALRIAKEKKPKILFAENVKGIINHDKGNTLDVIIRAMNDIGYVVDFNIINSKYFGVAQNRERVFIIGVRKDLIESEPFSEESTRGQTVVPRGKRRIGEWADVFNFDWPEQGEVTTRLRDILEAEVDEKYYLDEERTEKLVAQLEENNPRVGPDNDPQMVGHVDLKGHDAIKRTYSTEGISPTLTTMSGGHREPKIAEEQGSKPRYRIRKLTPRECFRLQAFPDEAHQALVDAGISDSQRYKMAGNSVTVSVIEALGERLIPLIG